MVKAFIFSVAELAFQAVLASVLIYTHRFFKIPVRAGLLRVYVEIGLPSKIMPVMSVNAVKLLMIALRIGTPNGFIVEVVEIYIDFVLADQVNCGFALAMSEGAVFTVVAFAAKTRRTEFGPIFVRVIELFDPSVAINTGIPRRALFLFSNVTAKF